MPCNCCEDQTANREDDSARDNGRTWQLVQWDASLILTGSTQTQEPRQLQPNQPHDFYFYSHLSRDAVLEWHRDVKTDETCGRT